jgi:hypothetical protein
MTKKIRKTQEEEIVAILKTEGFREISEKDIEEEPYKSIYALPDCITEAKLHRKAKTKAAK